MVFNVHNTIMNIEHHEFKIERLEAFKNPVVSVYHTSTSFDTEIIGSD